MPTYTPNPAPATISNNNKTIPKIFDSSHPRLRQLVPSQVCLGTLGRAHEADRGAGADSDSQEITHLARRPCSRAAPAHEVCEASLRSGVQVTPCLPVCLSACLLVSMQVATPVVALLTRERDSVGFGQAARQGKIIPRQIMSVQPNVRGSCIRALGVAHPL